MSSCKNDDRYEVPPRLLGSFKAAGVLKVWKGNIRYLTPPSLATPLVARAEILYPPRTMQILGTYHPRADSAFLSKFSLEHLPVAPFHSVPLLSCKSPGDRHGGKRKSRHRDAIFRRHARKEPNQGQARHGGQLERIPAA
jgi:hypothetical protein